MITKSEVKALRFARLTKQFFVVASLFGLTFVTHADPLTLNDTQLDNITGGLSFTISAGGQTAVNQVSGGVTHIQETNVNLSPRFALSVVQGVGSVADISPTTNTTNSTLDVQLEIGQNERVVFQRQDLSRRTDIFHAWRGRTGYVRQSQTVRIAAVVVRHRSFTIR